MLIQKVKLEICSLELISWQKNLVSAQQQLKFSCLNHIVLSCTAQLCAAYSRYNRCMKSFFGYTKHYSVTKLLPCFCLSSFLTVLLNSRSVLLHVRAKCNNSIVQLSSTSVQFQFSLFCISVLIQCYCLFFFLFCCLANRPVARNKINVI